ncbi:nucleoside-diphosphate sugar epimerase/dehydratase [Coprococcus comes]|uniref:Polysaccharide biosynthesis protein n=1 Tax=Coprococcus comes TaxID=410072 RepID=A0A849Y4H7_9FIRM|nr:nucleoside-diphosphate sugar epimerase/dehydratase [Coprococcus comes]NUN87956.1 polysaccharide biosynthesis protein [Coprococcus comes]
MKRNWGLQSSRGRMIALFIVDILSVIIDSYLAIILRFKLDGIWVPEEYMNSVEHYMIINVITTVVIFAILNLYNRVWSYASVYEMFLIIGAAMLSTAFQAFGFGMLYMPIPRSYYFFYFILLSITTLATRFSYRILHALQNGWKKSTKHSRNTIVIGAGEAGNMIIKELKSSRYLNQRVVCVIDDNPSKKGKYIHGIRIIGGRDMIQQAAKKYDAEEIILAIPSASTKDTRDILRICNLTECKLKILPGMYQLINDEVGVSNLREVSIEDLLGRDTINIDLESVGQYVSNKRILVTGGGGSIGSELCRQIASHNPKLLVIFDIYENNAYDIQQELIRKYPNLKLEVLIGSVRNTSRIESIMEFYRPDVVFHAAAHKHVPLMEDSPNEAIKNNVFGTYKTARAADKYGVKKFVLISTDKAVNPTNIMGASKRLCEMIVQTFSKYSQTEYVIVRFGNVLGSNGSVIPLFKKQMEAGGPVTVTHPDVIRYFMTIPEAVSLVLQAGAYAHGGEIFVLDMGEPVKIADLAKNLIRLSGYTLGVNMEIKYTGLRPGEKLYEELLTKEEGLQKTENDLIFIGKPLEFDEVHFLSQLRELEKEAMEESPHIKERVASIISTYHIRPEDKKRDSEIFKELLNMGKISHEGPSVETDHKGI